MSSDSQNDHDAVYSDDSDYQHHDSVLSTGHRNSLAQQHRQSKRVSYGRKHPQPNIDQILKKTQQQYKIHQTQSHIINSNVSPNQQIPSQIQSNQQTKIQHSQIIHENNLKQQTTTDGQQSTMLVSINESNPSDIFQVMQMSQSYQQKKPQINQQITVSNAQQIKAQSHSQQPTQQVINTDQVIDYLPDKFVQSHHQQTQATNQTEVQQQPQQSNQQTQQSQQSQQSNQQTQQSQQPQQKQQTQQPQEEYRQRSLSANSEQRKLSSDIPIQTEDNVNEQHGHSLGQEFNVQNEDERDEQILQSFRDSTQQKRRNRIPGNSQIQYADQIDGYVQPERKQSQNDHTQQQKIQITQEHHQQHHQQQIHPAAQVIVHQTYQQKQEQLAQPVQQVSQTVQAQQQETKVEKQQQRQYIITSQDTDLPERNDKQAVIETHTQYQQPESYTHTVEQATHQQEEVKQEVIDQFKQVVVDQPKAQQIQIQSVKIQQQQVSNQNANEHQTHQAQTPIQIETQQVQQKQSEEQQLKVQQPQKLLNQQRDQWPETYGRQQQTNSIAQQIQPKQPQTQLRKSSSSNQENKNILDKRISAQKQSYIVQNQINQNNSNILPPSVISTKQGELISIVSSHVNQSPTHHHNHQNLAQNQSQNSYTFQDASDDKINFNKQNSSQIVKSNFHSNQSNSGEVIDLESQKSSQIIIRKDGYQPAQEPIKKYQERVSYEVQARTKIQHQSHSQFISSHQKGQVYIQNQTDIIFNQSDIPSKKQQKVIQQQIIDPVQKIPQTKNNQLQASQYFVVDKNLSSLDIYGRSQYQQLNQVQPIPERPDERQTLNRISSNEVQLPLPEKKQQSVQEQRKSKSQAPAQIHSQHHAPRLEQQNKDELKNSVSNIDLALSTTEMKTTKNTVKKQKAGSNHKASVDKSQSCKCQIF